MRSCVRYGSVLATAPRAISLVSVLASAMLFAVATPASAEQGAGTIDDPVVIDAFPYAIADTTVGADSVIDSYSCASSVDESGPERVFRFALAAPARVTAWVEGDDGAVDIDVQLLDTPTLDGAQASDCVARGNRIAEAEMDDGEHYVVVDSYDGDAQAGPFVLRLEAIGDAWIRRAVADGVSWRARRYLDLHGSQVVHELIVDTTVAGVEVRALASSGCQTVGAVGSAAGAVAGVNGGYFGSGCAPVSLLKASGSFLAANATTRGAFGLTAGMVPLVEVVAAGENWPAAHEAHGGGPVLVVDSLAHEGAAAWAVESFSGSFLGDHPRTFAGIDAAGASHLVTVDGRRANAAGMSLDELAAFAAGDLALVDAVNLDGGGSTTMWVAGATPNGVVNYPSDATQEAADHPGSRPCSGGMFVFAPAYNHPPRFQTEPPTDAVVDQAYSYDADAIDLDVYDVVTYALLEAPTGMTVDETTGIVSYLPSSSAPPTATVTIEAADDAGGAETQSYTLTIEGGMGSGGSGGAGGGGGAGGMASGGGAVSEPPADADEGCSCMLGPRPEADSPWRLWLLAAGALLAAPLARGSSRAHRRAR